jgi:hypothetical protein
MATFHPGVFSAPLVHAAAFGAPRRYHYVAQTVEKDRFGIKARWDDFAGVRATHHYSWHSETGSPSAGHRPSYLFTNGTHSARDIHHYSQRI